MCDAENHGIAKFCIACFSALPPALAAHGSAPAAYALPSELLRTPRSMSAFAAAQEPGRSVWFSIAGLCVALTVGTAAGWMLAGPGAVYKADPEAMGARPIPVSTQPLAAMQPLEDGPATRARCDGAPSQQCLDEGTRSPMAVN
jgi:hypothetical protein